MNIKSELRDKDKDRDKEKNVMNEVNGFDMNKLPSLLKGDANDVQRSMKINTDFMKYKKFARF